MKQHDETSRKIVLGLATVVALVLIVIFVRQKRESPPAPLPELAYSEEVTKIEIEKKLLQALKDGSVCTAELTQNDFNKNAPLVINATEQATIAQANFQLQGLHSSSKKDSETIVTLGKEFGDGESSLKVINITFNNFKNTPKAGEYIAELRVWFKGKKTVSVKPFIKKFIVKTNLNDPKEAQRITDCRPYAAEELHECPKGYAMVGNPGSSESFCISEEHLSAATLDLSMVSCYKRKPVAHLCSVDEWRMACHLKVGDFGHFGGAEWLIDGTNKGYAGNPSDCSVRLSEGGGVSNPYRCCLR